MLKHLQKSVEEEELVWKSKMANSEEQLSAVCSTVSSKSLATFSFPKCWSPFCVFYLTVVPLTFPGFGEGQQAGGRKTKCSAGEEFFHTLNWPLILASRLEMCEPVCLGSRCS